MSLLNVITRCIRVPALHRALRAGATNWTLQSSGELEAYQLCRLNEVWTDAVANVPFYARWKEVHGLPDRIDSLEAYARWPVLRKQDLQRFPGLLVRRTARPFHNSVTSGATGEPLRFGTFPEQSQNVNACMLMARAGLDFFPGDRLFLLWGHRHFYGQGVKAKLRFFVRRCKDVLNNTYRADACDLTPRYMAFLERKFNRVDPEVIVAYSGSLLAFVRFAREKGLHFNGKRLRTIICTAGPLMKPEREEVSAFFGVPVYMEYGAMDTGQMAYMQKDGRYHVFQHARMIHTVNDGTGDVNVLTSLTPDYLPFFRYQVGDYLTDCSYTADGRVLSFAEVWGRGSDVITLPSGSKFQVISFLLCAEECPKVLAYQLVRRGDRYEYCVQTSAPLTDDERAHLLDCSYAICPELHQVRIDIVEKTELIKAKSGKIRLYVEA